MFSPYNISIIIPNSGSHKNVPVETLKQIFLTFHFIMKPDILFNLVFILESWLQNEHPLSVFYFIKNNYVNKSAFQGVTTLKMNVQSVFIIRSDGVWKNKLSWKWKIILTFSLENSTAIGWLCIRWNDIQSPRGRTILTFAFVPPPNVYISGLL